ncbi:uncharacterized protein LOC110845280 [Folsomia candida]|uniref:Uncharacterized protein n=1 Tax=Folsomia candida TaxID=158441 RepID=A0A226ER91_FOLCA|nr:uncharacterized protein LOC110845280 [Folsomia candida]OXA60153.1 hypothetical protein Fcan01_04060 [Folsomia candida]
MEIIPIKTPTSHSYYYHRVIILLPFLSLLLSPCATLVTTRKHKGEPEVDLFPGGGRGRGPLQPGTTLTLNVPPQNIVPPDQANMWESYVHEVNGPRRATVFITPNALRTKGDDGINDPRGTVRYNFMPNGYLGKGVITNPADESAPYTQANVPEMHANAYAEQGTLGTF